MEIVEGFWHNESLSRILGDKVIMIYTLVLAHITLLGR
jgi:hypothetical protein